MAMASSALVSSPGSCELRTCADLQNYLWGIPAYRIRLIPPPGQATERDLLAIQAKEQRTCELIDGILVEKEVATFQSRLAAVLIFFIELYLDDHPIGVALDGTGFLRLFPGRVRAPDVAYISWERIPGDEFPRAPIGELAPELAVEILSPGNTKGELDQKLKDYFRAGARLVWYVDPEARTVRVFTSPKRSALLIEADTLDGGKVLPGFTLPIKKWFVRASRKPRQ
jgi:Uma2 family endonuclease